MVSPITPFHIDGLCSLTTFTIDLTLSLCRTLMTGHYDHHWTLRYSGKKLDRAVFLSSWG